MISWTRQLATERATAAGSNYWVGFGLTRKHYVLADTVESPPLLTLCVPRQHSRRTTSLSATQDRVLVTLIDQS